MAQNYENFCLYGGQVTQRSTCANIFILVRNFCQFNIWQWQDTGPIEVISRHLFLGLVPGGFTTSPSQFFLIIVRDTRIICFFSNPELADTFQRYVHNNYRHKNAHIFHTTMISVCALLMRFMGNCFSHLAIAVVLQSSTQCQQTLCIISVDTWYPPQLKSWNSSQTWA